MIDILKPFGNIKLWFVPFLLILISNNTIAQNSSVRGFVYEKETSEPVIFTKVVLKGTTLAAVTDVNGYFSIGKVPAGKYKLMASGLGLDSVEVEISIKENEIVSQKIYLPKKSQQLKEMVVTGEKQERQNDTKVSVNKITIKELKKLPTIGGEADLAQYLQVLPGVVFTGDQGGQLFIRGGTPVQNKMLLDGMIIYNPFHSIGLYSVLDADIIRNADVYTGGFGAQYGGRISSIMDITTRDGNKKNLSGKLAMNTIGSKFLIEGPIIKDKEDQGYSSSFIFSAKNSYLSTTSKALYPYAGSNGLPFDFLDLYGKASVSTNNGSKVNIFGFRHDDRVSYPNIADIRWIANGVGSNFVVIPSSSQTLIKGSFSYSDYDIKLNEQDGLPRSSKINGFNFGFDFTNFVGKNEVNYGIEGIGFNTNYQFTNAYKITSSSTQSNTEIAGFIRYKMNFNKIILDPSVRMHYYASIAEPSIEPRMALKWNITDDIRFKAAGGIYSQNLFSASSDRDVVNLFYGFLSSPENLQTTFTRENGNILDVDSKLQRAWHAIAGFEFDLNDNLTLNTEIYNKQFFQLININPNKKFDDTEANRNRPEMERKQYLIEEGYARGIDLNLKYEYKKFYLWLVHSITYVTRFDGVQKYQPHFDRRHNSNVVLSYNFGKALDWEASLRWNFGSGFPFTRTRGVYEQLDFQNGIGTDYVADNGQIGFIYGPLNAGRLPTYHRLDANIKKRFVLSERSIIETTLSVTNLYNRANIFYVNRVNGSIVNQLPILPTLNISWSF